MFLPQTSIKQLRVGVDVAASAAVDDISNKWRKSFFNPASVSRISLFNGGQPVDNKSLFHQVRFELLRQDLNCQHFDCCSTRQSVASPPSDLHFTQYKSQPRISQNINNSEGKPCTTTSSTSPDLHYQTVSNQAKTVAYVESHSFQDLGPLSRDSLTSPPSDWGPSSSSKRENDDEDEKN